MRKKLIDRMYVGDLRDCQAADASWIVVHACKNPCHSTKCGQQTPNQPTYLHLAEGSQLWLNMIDAPTPDLLPKKLFVEFLNFTKAQWDGERSMLIHCNKGDSRAPSLALLFLAKVLYRIRNSSFDDAWVDFERLAGETFAPGEGIELYLREHWRELDLEKPPELVAQKPAMARFAMPTDPAVARALIEAQPLVHFACFTQIQNKAKKWISPAPNALQRKIAEAYNWCQNQGIPCRLIILKPRQVGCSTFVAELCYHHIRQHRSEMLCMSDTVKRAMVIWDLLKGIDSHDKFPWKSRITKANTEVIEITFPDGEKGKVQHETAMDPKAGISGTRQVIWWTEAARYLKPRDKSVMSASMISLANEPNTLGVAESTPEGATGWFYETWKGAVSLEDRKAGKKDERGNLVIGNSWIKLFASWFEFPEHTLQRTPENADFFREDLDDAERRGLSLYRWTPEQVAWRRKMLSAECRGDINMLNQDFAEDPESCFLASGRARFGAAVLADIENVARTMHSRAEVGILERSPSGEVSFRPTTDGDSWAWIAERPKFGCSYIGGIDPCTGEQSEGSMFPDAHGAEIWRAGYFEQNRWHPPMLVACISLPNGCRYDDDELADKMKRLLDFYGNPLCAVETGNGLGVLGEMKRVGAVLYKREKHDMMYNRPLEVLGWETNRDTRPLLINCIANYIREFRVDQPTFDCHYLPLVDEMRTFIVDERGKAQAKHGAHDDLLMCASLCLFLIDQATPMAPPNRQRWTDGPTAPTVTMPGGVCASAFS